MTKQTALYQMHLQHKAKMADFQGWLMPFQYADAQEEYLAVRSSAGLFDVSHLGRIELAGPDASVFLEKIFTRNVSRLSEGSSIYGLICNETGGMLDVALLFRLNGPQAAGRYMLTTNASPSEKIVSWLKSHAGPGIQISDGTDTLAQLALQGPRSFHILDRLAGPNMKKIKPRGLREIPLPDMTVLVSRTGYTGEQGYELFVAAEHAEKLWNALMDAGREAGLVPCGISSRDVLRMEMGYPMYGSEIDENRNPLEAGLGRFIDMQKDFIGRDALMKIKADGVKQKLVGFVLLDKGVPKSGGSIFSENRDIGVVTSGNHSPHLRKGIGLGYVVSRYSQPGQEIEIEVRDKEIAARIVDLPFYRKK